MSAAIQIQESLVSDRVVHRVTETGDVIDGETLSGGKWHLHNGDALRVSRNLPSNEFNCIVTSPPYFWLRDYETDDQIGLENSVGEYVEKLCILFDELKRTLAKDGLMFLNLGDTYYSGKGESQGIDSKNKLRRFGLRAVDRSGGLGIGLKPKTMIGIPWRVATAMTERGWILRSSIIWHRSKSLSENVKDRPSRSYEFVFMFSKHKRYYFNRANLASQKLEEDVWSIRTRPKKNDGIKTAPFPDELVERCLAIGCPPGGKVLDPFVGSGTTMRVALRKGFEAFGIENNLDFCKHIQKELAKL